MSRSPPAIGPDELRELEELAPTWAETIADLDVRVRQHPLTTWRAWTGHLSSQLVSLRACGGPRPPKHVCFTGGNRSGKTDAAFRLCLHYTLGADHPETILWASVNGIDISRWPVGPGIAFVCALDSASSVKYHRPLFAAHRTRLPSRWQNEKGKGPATLEIQVPGYEIPAVFYFTSVDQGRDAFQGSSIRDVWMDEEEHDRDLPVSEEAEIRLGDQDGLFVRSMTPYLNGYSWAVPFLHEGQAERNGWAVFRLYTEDNPHTNFDRIKKSVRGNKSLAAARLRGEWAISVENSIYGFPAHEYTFDPEAGATLTGRPVARPPEGDPEGHWRGHDYGSTRDPTATVFAYITDANELVVTDEYCETHPDQQRHVKAVRAIRDPAECNGAWGDKRSKQIREDWGSMGLPAAVCQEDALKETIDRVVSLFAQRRIFISARCVTLLRELREYQWDPLRPTPRKGQSDHLLDALRYMVVGLIEAGVLAPGDADWD